MQERGEGCARNLRRYSPKKFGARAGASRGSFRPSFGSVEMTAVSGLLLGRALDADGPYRASKKDCDVCELKARCCPNAAVRKIPRHLDEDCRDVARALAGTPEFEAASRRRKKVEMLFAHLKRILRLGRLRLRGPSGAKDEFLLAATAQNLRRLARLRPAGIAIAA